MRLGAASGVRMVMRVGDDEHEVRSDDEAETESGNQSTGKTQCI